MVTIAHNLKYCWNRTYGEAECLCVVCSTRRQKKFISKILKNKNFYAPFHIPANNLKLFYKVVDSQTKITISNYEKHNFTATASLQRWFVKKGYLKSEENAGVVVVPSIAAEVVFKTQTNEALSLQIRENEFQKNQKQNPAVQRYSKKCTNEKLYERVFI